MTLKQLWSILRGRRTNFSWSNASWTYYPDGDPMGKNPAPATIEVDGVWYDRRDTVVALTKLLADARAKIETYQGIIKEYRLRDLERNPTPPPSHS